MFHCLKSSLLTFSLTKDFHNTLNYITRIDYVVPCNTKLPYLQNKCAKNGHIAVQIDLNLLLRSHLGKTYSGKVESLYFWKQLLRFESLKNL